MNNKLRFLTVISLVAVLTLSTVTVFAGTSWNSFAGVLPSMQQWIELTTDTNLNNTYAQAQILSVGGEYKMNMNVYDKNVSPEKQVSATYLDATDGTLAKFNLDSSSLNHTVGLRGWAARWSIYEVEYSGQFRADQ